ncbi:MAG: phosphoglycerate dehydrogenase [Anaerolineales bacterium]|jgi:D-3-phosphoglycerate dehydrogenase
MSDQDLKSCHILVTSTSFGINDPTMKTKLEEQVGQVTYNTLGRPYTSTELQELLRDVDGYIAGLDEIDRVVIQSAPKLRVISRYGVGVDNVDLEAAKDNNVVVTNTPGANTASVAELTVGLILVLVRSIYDAVISTKVGEWPRCRGVSLEGKTIGLIGFGKIGQEVARKLAGFDCQILAFDIAPDFDTARQYHVELVEFDELLKKSDILSLHCSLVSETGNLLNQKSFNKMKDGVYLINTARGELIDEDALLEALNRGKIHGAAVDVFSQQPPDPDNLLLQHPKVITTPHMGSHTDLAMNKMGWWAVRDCLAVLRGDEPEYRII